MLVGFEEVAFVEQSDSVTERIIERGQVLRLPKFRCQRDWVGERTVQLCARIPGPIEAA